MSKAYAAGMEFRIQRLHEPVSPTDRPLGDDPDRVANYWRQSVPKATWFNPDVECLVVILLDTKRRITGHQMVSIGIADSLLVHSRELFRPAIIASANAVIMVHNHPSGDPEPSTADIKITRQIVEAGKILHMPLLDHLVMGHDRFVSLASRGFLTK